MFSNCYKMYVSVSFGGILGLFLGISIFTVFEFIFYFAKLLKAFYKKCRGKTYDHEKIQDSTMKNQTSVNRKLPDLPPIEGDLQVFVL